MFPSRERRYQMKKQLNKELEKIRDEIAAFNATRQVNWEMPEDLL